MIDKIKKKFNKIGFVDIFLIISPIIDFTTTFSILILKMDISFGIVMRFLLLIFLFIHYVIKSEKKVLDTIYFFFLIFFSSIFFYDYVNSENFNDLFIELKGFAKIFYFPVLLIIFNSLITDKNIYINKSITLSGVIYGTFILIPTILNVSLLTYLNGKAGFIGWFYAPNEIGAILGIISPIVLYECINLKNNLISMLMIYIFVISISIIGTKAPIIALIISLISIILIYFIKILFFKLEKKNKYHVIKMVLITIFIVISVIFVSPLKENIKFQINSNTQIDNKEQYEEVLKDENDKINELKKEIENKIEDKICKNKILNLIFSSREVLAVEGFKKWSSSSPKNILFGQGIYENKVQRTVEIDFFDILFSYGIFGMIIYFMPLIIIMFKLMLYLFKHMKMFFKDIEIYVYTVSLLLSLSISLIAGHVLTAPAVSIFVAIVSNKINSKIKKSKL